MFKNAITDGRQGQRISNCLFVEQMETQSSYNNVCWEKGVFAGTNTCGKSPPMR